MDKEMTPKEEAIRNFHERAVETERVLDALDEAVGCEPDSPLKQAMWALTGGYINALGAAYAIDDWLEWWWTECRLGENPMKAKVGKKPERLIATVDDLVLIIMDDAKESLLDEM